MKRLVVLMMVAAFVGAATFSVVSKARAATPEKHKVHLTAKVMGTLGVTDKEVEQACEEALGDNSNLNVEFVDEKGDGVEEFTVVMQVDDDDDDDDGIADAKDNDDNGDGIADAQEVIGEVDMDKQDPTVLKELGDTKPGQGINILLAANDEAHHIIRFHTNADAPTEGDKASLNHAMNSFAAHATRSFIPKWLKTTFTVVKYVAKGVSCATGSFTSCFSLLAAGYAK